MKPAYYYSLLIAMGLMVLSACDFEDDPFSGNNAENVRGLRPIYASQDELMVRFESARPMERTRKLYQFGSYLYINEIGKGIHVVDFSNPMVPIRVGFIRITGNVDLAVKDGYVYADQAGAILTIDINNLADVRVVNRIENQLQDNTRFPSDTRFTYFECPDPGRGVVIAWEEAVLPNPKCYRQ